MARDDRPFVYEFGDFRLDPQQHLLSSREGAPVAVTPRALEMLTYFAEHPGQLVAKATLLKSIWPNVVVEENNLNQHLSRLRRALGDDYHDHRYIVTVPGRGYRFVADVRREERSPPGMPAERFSDRGASSSGDSRPELPFAAVAVLPFANVTGDPTKEYLGDGMAEQLIYLLASNPELKVSARTSSFAYKGRNIDVRRIARDLGVAAILEGSIRSAGERIRVTAQLVNASTGYHVWSQSFDRTFDDIFRLQDEIATAIVQSFGFQARITSPDTKTSSPPTRDVEAYRLYMQGVSMGGRGGEQPLLRAIDLLQQAIARDPSFARAYAVLAGHRVALIFYGRPDVLSDAQREAEKALSLDPTLANAHSVLGMVSVVGRRWLDAESHFRAASARGGEDLAAYRYRVFLHASAGHHRKALEALRNDYRSAPAVPAVPAVLAAATLALPLEANATADALRYFELAVDLGAPRDAGPLPAVRWYAALRLGNHAEATAAAQDLVGRLLPALRNAGAAEVLELVYTAVTNPELRAAAVDALTKLIDTVALAQVGPELSIHVIACYTLLDAVDQAYDFAYRMLDYAMAHGTTGIFLPWMWIPELTPFRRHRRFLELMTRLGLMEYWQAYGTPDGCQLEAGRLICR